MAQGPWFARVWLWTRFPPSPTLCSIWRHAQTNGSDSFQRVSKPKKKAVEGRYCRARSRVHQSFVDGDVLYSRVSLMMTTDVPANHESEPPANLISLLLLPLEVMWEKNLEPPSVLCG